MIASEIRSNRIASNRIAQELGIAVSRQSVARILPLALSLSLHHANHQTTTCSLALSLPPSLPRSFSPSLHPTRLSSLAPNVIASTLPPCRSGPTRT